MADLKTIEINSEMGIYSFDIENVFTNIPKRDIINIINSVLGSNTEVHTKVRNVIIQMLEKVME
jgi:hypothetical protein